MNRHSERGLGGWIFLAVLGALGYVAASIGPVYFDDYNIRLAMKGALGDYVAFLTTAETVPEMFAKRAKELKVDTKDIVPEYQFDEGQRDWATGTVKYTRTWKLIGTNKSYKKTFTWTQKEKR